MLKIRHQWNINLGVSDYICNDRDSFDFSTYEPFKSMRAIQRVSGKLFAIDVGDVHLTIKVP